MFTLLRRCSGSDLAVVQAPAFLGALAIAELLYKFGSFLLETLAFLATWLALDAAISFGRGLLRRPAAGRSMANRSVR